MRISKGLSFFVLFLFFLTIPGFSGGEPIHSKFDPGLRIRWQEAGDVLAKKEMKVRPEEFPPEQATVKTIVKFNENLDGVEKIGGKIGSIIGDIATVQIPLGSLEALSRLENIVYVEAAKKKKPKLRFSVPETGVNLLRGGTPPPWTGVTGRNVVIGFVDSGLDLAHPDFRDARGKTRILYLWDQEEGQKCTQTMIDEGACVQIDWDGHGTHIAGIAAGNGSASNYEYIGMAPEANLIIVKTTFMSSDILDGLSYIQKKAVSSGKPSVITLSLGGHNDPHDGTSLFSRALDKASGSGKILIGAAGNEANDAIHTTGNVVQETQAVRAFNVPEGEGVVFINLWYPGVDALKVRVGTPGCSDTDWVEPDGTKKVTTRCGRISISSTLNNPINGDKEILLKLTNPSAGEWKFVLYGSSVTNGRFDAWIDDTEFWGETPAFTDSDTSLTITDVGSTTKVISVGSYVTYPLEGDPMAGDISSFSSRGPRRMCSKCSFVQKPDLTAPGQWIMSAFSGDTIYFNPDDQDRSGEPYIRYQGTSMAAPHVAGAVGLLLQKNRSLTPEDVKNYIPGNAKRDSFTGEVPNDIWGYGKLDGYQAYLAAPGPDLTGSWETPVGQTCKSTSRGQRCSINGILTVYNAGTRDAPSTHVGVYLSNDDIYDEGDILLKRLSTGKIKAGSFKSRKFSYTLPLGNTAAGKYIIAFIDKENVVLETDEPNNKIISGPIQ